MQYPKIKTWLVNLFLQPEEHFSGRRSLSLKNILWFLGFPALLILILVGHAEQTRNRENVAKQTAFVTPKTGTPTTEGHGNTAPMPRDPFAGQFGGGTHGTVQGFSSLNAGIASSQRNHNANQVIRRGDSGTDPESALPMGFGVPVRLVNAIQSGQTTTPVIAEVTQDVISHDGVSIPQGTRAIGQASVDESAHRIQIHFQTLVYPEGGQHSVQALAMMPDGSAGLEGDYHSGQGTRQVGRFLGTFIGGIAQGMTEQASGGVFGNPYAVGSVKNGLLNGISQSAQDQTKTMTDDLTTTKATMSLQSGQGFILYLEKEYQP